MRYCPDCETDREFEEAREFFDEFEGEELEGGAEFEQGEYESEQPDLHPQLGYLWPGPPSREFEGELEDEIFGKRDSRKPVRNTLDVPYRWICALDIQIDIPGVGTRWGRGTGTLISPRHVLTAAHNLFVAYGKIRVKAKSITVTPARDRTTSGTAPFGSKPAEKLFYPTEWESRDPEKSPPKFSPLPFHPTTIGDPEYDFGVIQLPAGSPLSEVRHAKLNGQQLGFWGHKERGEGTSLEIIPGKALKGKRVWVAGYPADKCEFHQIKKDKQGKMLKDADQPKAVQQCLAKSPYPRLLGPSLATAQFEDDGKFVDPEMAPDSTNTLMHTIDTFGGHSGSPMWIQEGRLRKFVAIHTGYDWIDKGGKKGEKKLVNRCVRISSDVRRYLAEWMR
jgi:V8-like Glu-specific endopeptidase